MFLYSLVSSQLDRSKCSTLHPMAGRYVISGTNSTSLGSIPVTCMLLLHTGKMSKKIHRGVLIKLQIHARTYAHTSSVCVCVCVCVSACVRACVRACVSA